MPWLFSFLDFGRWSLVVGRWSLGIARWDPSRMIVRPKWGASRGMSPPHARLPHLYSNANVRLGGTPTFPAARVRGRLRAPLGGTGEAIQPAPKLRTRGAKRNRCPFLARARRPEQGNHAMWSLRGREEGVPRAKLEGGAAGLPILATGPKSSSWLSSWGRRSSGIYVHTRLCERRGSNLHRAGSRGRWR